MMPTNVKQIPGAITHAYFKAVRMSLRAAERLSGQAGNDSWPPAMALEGFEATIEALVGTLTRDESLTRSAELRRAKLAKLREAAVLETEAEVTREKAEERFEERRESAQQRRAAATAAAEKQKAAARQQAEQRKKAAEREAADKIAAARATKAKGDEAIDRQERAAKLEVLENEDEALEASRDAIKAEETVDLIDETIEAHKESRKTG
ncbi:MAG TPA: hypothetical protein VHB69_03340 [Mycobacteriales bacterium]|nr:hypothetical protein [Mycobacteriales bacterium]